MTDPLVETGAAPARGRRRFLRAGMAVLAASSAFDAAAIDPHFPARPVRLIVPTPPGGATDSIVRILTDKLARLWGQNIVIDHRPGAGTILASSAIARAAPDGYVFGMVISAHAINAAMRNDLPYDPVEDFTPLTLLGFPIAALVAHESFPAQDVAGLLKACRGNPGSVSYASLGTGTGTHLAGELLNSLAGTAMVHVPYHGSAAAYRDLLTGRVPVGFVVLDSAMPHVRAGRLRVLGITNARRSRIRPEYPAISETVPGYAVEGSIGFLAPAHLPPGLAAKISADLQQVIALPQVREHLAALNVEPVGSTGPQFGSFLENEIRRWTPLVKRLGLRAE
jgi:tripartite-type tricarboxylate transporter receptor subunit TctC